MMVTRRGLIGLAAGIATAGTLAACANPVESLIKKGVEKGIEAGTGSKVDIDEGTVEIDGGSVSVDTGKGASLPDNWPNEIPLPKGNPLVAVTSEDGMLVTFQVTKAEAEEVLARFEGAGFTKGDGSMDAGDMKMYTFENADWSVGVQLLTEGDDVTLGYIVSTRRS